MSGTEPQLSAALPHRALASLLADQSVRVAARETGVAQLVPLPAMPTGAAMLRGMPIRQVPEGSDWREPFFRSTVPRVVTYRDALVHGGAGIVRAGMELVTDTLFFTNSLRDGYELEPGGIRLRRRGPVERLATTAVSLLAPGHAEDGTWLLDCIGRLAALDAAALDGATRLLVPPPATEFQRATLDLALRDLASRGHALAPRIVAPDESVEVRTLVAPDSVLADDAPHPCLRAWLDTLLAGAGTGAPATAAARIYLDGRGQPGRTLENEDEVVHLLEQQGFVAVRLDALDLGARARLMRQAEVVVGAHGRALAGLALAAPGCRVIELHVDSMVNWRTRSLCAVFDLPYDCVVGKVAQGAGAATMGQERWSVSAIHVAAAAGRSR